MFVKQHEVKDHNSITTYYYMLIYTDSLLTYCTLCGFTWLSLIVMSQMSMGCILHFKQTFWTFVSAHLIGQVWFAAAHFVKLICWHIKTRDHKESCYSLIMWSMLQILMKNWCLYMGILSWRLNLISRVIWAVSNLSLQACYPLMVQLTKNGSFEFISLILVNRSRSCYIFMYFDHWVEK